MSAMYAWVTTLPDGLPSLIGTYLEGQHLPLIHHDLELIKKFRPAAVRHGEELGQAVKLIRLAYTATLEEIPKP